MTIRTSLIDYLGDGAEGETIAEVLRSGLDAEGSTIGAVVADAAGSSDETDEESDGE